MRPGFGVRVGQRTEDRGRRTEDGRTKDGRQRTKDGRTEEGRTKDGRTEDRRQRTEDEGLSLVLSLLSSVLQKKSLLCPTKEISPLSCKKKPSCQVSHQS